MVGDNIDQFKSNDLVFIGTYTPHEYIGDPKHFEYPDGFQEEAIVIQFLYDFLGDNFFRLPENSGLNRFILGSTRGYVFFGESKKKIISIMLKMQDMNEGERFYSLISIFKIFASTKEFRILSSLAFSESFSLDESGSMKKALKFISQNFQENIKIKDLLEITNMSNTSFFEKFKQTYRMPFKDYLLNIRVGYACKLLTDESQNISGIAYASGFGNISNFNRQFKKIKGITPSQFEEKLKKMRMKI
jgi:AraC-like DNA-binding protein